MRKWDCCGGLHLLCELNPAQYRFYLPFTTAQSSTTEYLRHINKKNIIHFENKVEM